MDNKALYKLAYGVFLLGAKAGDKKNACITNTCIQVAGNPTRVAIAVINTNYTCDLIKEGGVFAVSILDKKVPFETLKHFGMQSGRDVDKLDGLPLPEDVNGVPYMNWNCCAVLSCKVVDSMDLGSHTLSIGEVVDAVKQSDEPMLTYDYYQSDIKPKPAPKPEEKKVVAWKCKICGYIYEGSELPSDFICPICGHDASDFEPVYG